MSQVHTSHSRKGETGTTKSAVKKSSHWKASGGKLRLGAEVSGSSSMDHSGDHAPAAGGTPLPLHLISPLPTDRTRIQTKLRIGAPGDRYEQEADRVAEDVVRGVSLAGAQGITPLGAGGVQKKCAACEDEEKMVQRKPSDDESPVMEEKPSGADEPVDDAMVPRTDSDEKDIPVALKSLPGTKGSSGVSDVEGGLMRGGGRPMQNADRSFFESRMGFDFSQVRIHTGSEARGISNALNARALTHGNHIYFGAGEYAPGTTEGNRLLAHELTHVVQQGGSSGTIQRQPDDPDPTKPVITVHVTVTQKDIDDHDYYLTSALMEAFKVTRPQAEIIKFESGYHWVGKPNPTRVGEVRSVGVTVDATMQDAASRAGNQTPEAQKNADAFSELPQHIKDVLKKVTKNSGISSGSYDYKKLRSIGEKLLRLPKGFIDEWTKLSSEGTGNLDDFEKLVDRLLELSPEQREQLLRSKSGEGKGSASTTGEYHGNFDDNIVPGLGIVQNEKEGAYLYETASASGTGIQVPYNTTLAVITKSEGFYFVRLESGRLGYIDASLINTQLPEPKAKLYRIKGDDTADKIAREHYTGLDTVGADARLYVNGMRYVNEVANRKGIFGSEYGDTHVKADAQIWIPSQEYVLRLRNWGVISSESIRYELTQLFLDTTVGPAAFSVGVVHGALESLWDLVTGIADLIGMAWSVLESLFTGTILEDAANLVESIQNMDIGQLFSDGLESFLDKWNDPNVLKRWHYRGWLIGYIAMEIIMEFFTAGIATAVKGFAKGVKFVKFLEKFPVLKKAQDMAQKMKLAGKADDLITALKNNPTLGKAVQKLHDLQTWVKAKFRRASQRTVEDLDTPAIERLQTLDGPTLEKLAELDDVNLRRVLGCASPCDVDLEEIRRLLAVDNADVKKLGRDYRGHEKIVEETLEETGGDAGRAKRLMVERVGLDDTTKKLLGEHHFNAYDPVHNKAVRTGGTPSYIGDKIRMNDQGAWEYIAKNGDMAVEHSVSTHGTLTKAPNKTDHFFESHHVLQDKVMKDLFSQVPASAWKNPAMKYNRNDAVAILLRNRVAESPHRLITNAQGKRLGTTKTVMQEYKSMLSDLNLAGVPEPVRAKVLDQVNSYFGNLYHNISDIPLRDRIFGGWVPK